MKLALIYLFLSLIRLKGLTVFSDSCLFPEIGHCDKRYDACRDNDLLHAGGDGGIKDTRGTGDSTLEKCVLVRQHKFEPGHGHHARQGWLEGWMNWGAGTRHA